MDFISVPYWCPFRDAGRTEMNEKKWFKRRECD